MTIQETIKMFKSDLVEATHCRNVSASMGLKDAATHHSRRVEGLEIVLEALREKAEREEPKPRTKEDAK